MKKILLIISIFPIVARAQQVQMTDNPNYLPISVDSIGRFKIDQSTTAIIDSISKESSVPVVETIYPLGKIPETMGTIKSTVSIYELEKDSSGSSSDEHAMRQKDVRVFYLNYYNTGDAGINNIYLKFYKDTLIEFTCNPAPSNGALTISDVFRSKYGEPASVTTSKKPVACQSGNAISLNYEESFTSSLWITKNKEISAFEYINISYPNCKKKTYHVFTMADDTKNRIVDDIEKKFTSESEIEKKKKGLKN